MYSANITGGGLLLQESRILAQKLLSGVPLAALMAITLSENLLQKRSPATTSKMAGLIISRLSLLDEKFLRLVAEGDKREASLLLLAAISEAHELVGDFLLYIGRECFAQYQKILTEKDWEKFFDQCAQKQPSLNTWSDSTVKKLRNVVFKILLECEVIDDKTNELHPLILPNTVRAYLEAPQKGYARRCLEGLV